MASEGCVSHSSPTYTNDPLNSSPEEYQSGESPMVWNVNGISSEYGLGMTPGTYLPPSTYHPNLFGQASTDSFPIYYGANGEIMPDQRRHTSTIVLDHRELTNIGHSAFQDSYVAAQSVRCVVDPDLLSSMDAQRLPSQPLRNDLDELLLLSSYLSYPQVPLSLHSSVRNDPGPSDLQDWFSSIDGGSDDTWFSSFIFGGLDNSFGAENPSAPGHYSMESTNCAQPGSYSLIDFLTSAPGTNNVPDVENPNAFHAVPGSVPPPEYTDVVFSGIQTSQCELSLRPTHVFPSYPSPPHPSVSDPYPSGVQERSSSNDGGSDDPSLSSSPSGDLDDSMGAEDSSVGGNSRAAMNCAQSDLCSRTDHIPDGDNAKALHPLFGSIPLPGDASPLAFRITSSQYHPSVTEKLLKPCPDGYKEARVNSIQKWRGGPHSLLSGLSVYYLRDSPATLHPCPVDGCTAQFSGNGIRTHLRTKHPGITTQPYLQCKECNPEASIVAKNYANHILDRHSGHSILCAYCLSPQSRVKNLPRHLLKHCSGLAHAKKRKAVT